MLNSFWICIAVFSTCADLQFQIVSDLRTLLTFQRVFGGSDLINLDCLTSFDFLLSCELLRRGLTGLQVQPFNPCADTY